MTITQAQIDAIEATAIANATRGVSEVTVGDRTHKFSSPVLMWEFVNKLKNSLIDDTYGGRVNLTMGRADGT